MNTMSSPKPPLTLTLLPLLSSLPVRTMAATTYCDLHSTFLIPLGLPGTNHTNPFPDLHAISLSTAPTCSSDSTTLTPEKGTTTPHFAIPLAVLLAHLVLFLVRHSASSCLLRRKEEGSAPASGDSSGTEKKRPGKGINKRASYLPPSNQLMSGSGRPGGGTLMPQLVAAIPTLLLTTTVVVWTIMSYMGTGMEKMKLAGWTPVFLALEPFALVHLYGVLPKAGSDGDEDSIPSPKARKEGESPERRKSWQRIPVGGDSDEGGDEASRGLEKMGGSWKQRMIPLGLVTPFFLAVLVLLGIGLAACVATARLRAASEELATRYCSPSFANGTSIQTGRCHVHPIFPPSEDQDLETEMGCIVLPGHTPSRLSLDMLVILPLVMLVPLLDIFLFYLPTSRRACGLPKFPLLSFFLGVAVLVWWTHQCRIGIGDVVAEDGGMVGNGGVIGEELTRMILVSGFGFGIGGVFIGGVGVCEVELLGVERGVAWW